jgi:hypothetical protein
MKKGSWFVAHDNIAFQERFPLSILACVSLPFSFFVVTVPVMGVYKNSKIFSVPSVSPW